MSAGNPWHFSSRAVYEGPRPSQGIPSSRQHTRWQLGELPLINLFPYPF